MLLMNAPGSDPVAPSLDLTPIIDMVFNLLIFFLIASSFQQVEREMRIALPQTRAAGPLSAALREIVVNVTSDGRAIVAGREMSEEDLDSMIRTAVEANAAQKVSVRGDRRTPYGEVARVLDTCKRAGVSEPYLQTVPTE
jgi:biopolymer transport protein ExbD